HGWVLDESVLVTNPNVIQMGKPGTQKSTTVKCTALRMMEYGYRLLILGDIKDEYVDVCRALGQEPFEVGIGLPARINPLDFGPLRQGWERLDRQEIERRSQIVFSRWLTLVGGLV